VSVLVGSVETLSLERSIVCSSFTDVVVLCGMKAYYCAP